MRRTLDRLYDAAAYLAALFLVGTLVMVLLGIFGRLLSFQLRGGKAEADRFVGALELITLASSLGGFSTLICTPSTMTHRGMPPEAQREAGIAPDLLRLSVGLEDGDDLVADLERAFAVL